MKQTRRSFLKSSVLTAAAVSLPARLRAAADGANGDIRIAVIGFHGRGQEHIKSYTKLSGVRIVGLCDVDKEVLDKGVAELKTKGHDAEGYTDLRKLLENKDIDAVSIATPNHWHSLATIWACQAGKDVYVEKPVSHNIFEGRKMVEAARKYNRIVQTGTQCRSHKGIQDAVAFLRSGKLGQVYMARGLCYKWRPSIGNKPDSAVPDGLDYNLWTGPAEMKPFNANRLHYNWHWFWNTGNGDLGNQGIHQMDIARWGLGKTEFPKAVQASGGRFGYKDDGETPNTETVTFDFDDSLLEFEVRGLPTNEEAGAKVGDVFYGSEGVLAITSYYDWQTYFGQKMEKGPGGKGSGDHFRNFLTAVKARDRKLLAADIEEGHLSSAYCHLGNIAYRLGRKLHINPSTESFVNDSAADAMLTREYRAPFVVPEKV
jgi:predicted dehydrogenase